MKSIMLFSAVLLSVLFCALANADSQVTDINELRSNYVNELKKCYHATNGVLKFNTDSNTCLDLMKNINTKYSTESHRRLINMGVQEKIQSIIEKGREQGMLK